jgi:DNA-binding MarR family transcriptional regulator
MANSFDPAFQENDLTSKLVVGLERLSEVFRVLLWEQSKTTGLSPIQIQLLIFIKNHHSKLANVSDLSKEFNLKKPTVSDAIKVLYNKGLITKEAREDARAYTIRLTSEGIKMVSQVEDFAEPLRNSLSELSSDEKNSFYSALTEVIFKLNQTGIIQVQRTCFACKYYDGQGEGHYCKLLDRPLQNKDLRLDCNEFESSLI